MRSALLVLVLTSGLAWSANHETPITSSSDKKTQSEQKGSEKSPIFVSGEITTKKTKEESQSDAAERKEKFHLDTELVKFTFWLAVTTIALFFAAAIQAGLFVWQLRLMSKSAKDAGDAAQAALTSAHTSEVVAQTARDEFIATHRPRIRIKHLWINEDFLSDNEIKVSLVVVNNGDTPAKHLQGEITTIIVPREHRLPAKPSFAGVMVFKTTVEELPSGITLEFANLTDNRKLSTSDWINLRNIHSILYCYGYVDYLDSANRLRRTTFCRALRPTQPSALLSVENARFAKLDHNDEDYEYQD